MAPFFMDIFLQQIVNGLVLGSVYALVALGYTMVYGILGLINFAHGEVVMVGALTALSVIDAADRRKPRAPGPLHRRDRLAGRGRRLYGCSASPSSASPTGRCDARRASRR